MEVNGGCSMLHPNYVSQNKLLKTWHYFSALLCSGQLLFTFMASFWFISGVTVAMDDYTKIEKIGEGKYGELSMAKPWPLECSTL